MKVVILAVAIVAIFSSCEAADYQLAFDFGTTNFFDNWNFFTGGDPTNGHVKFVDQNTAKNNGLIRTNSSGAYMGVDYKNKAPNGRMSVRLQSKKSWKSALFILRLSHMPGSVCGIWPAFWSNGPGTWPYGGEIDVLEQVNKANTNQYTLHTGPNCKMPASRNMSGTWTQSNNCDNTQSSSGGGAGCAVKDRSSSSFGSAFNGKGGGAIAYDIKSTGIRIWTFSGSLPSDINSNTPRPNRWRVPDAFFPFGNDCSRDHFGPQTLIFDTTFCGDWAGSSWVYSTQAGCPGSCVDYVSNNPQAFKDAFWNIQSLKVYQYPPQKSKN